MADAMATSPEDDERSLGEAQAPTADTESQPSSPKAHHCLVPYPRDDSIVDRPDLLDNLHRLLSDTSECRQTALWGPGGCGKTHMAVEYAHRQEAHGFSVFWAHADTETGFYQDFCRIAKELRLDNTLKGENLLTAVRGKLESLQGWLLVLDNVKSVDLFQAAATKGACTSLHKYIPEPSKGSILWTSRSKSVLETILGQNETIEVGHLTSIEALQLLQVKMAEPINENEWEQAMILFEELHWSPLAISLASSYLQASQSQLGDYVYKVIEITQQLELQDSDMSNSDQGAMYGVLKVWHISANKILEDDPMSHAMIHVLSNIHNQKIPFHLLSAIWKRVSNDFLDSAEETEDQESKQMAEEAEGSADDQGVKQHITRLCEISLLNTTNSNSEYYQMNEMLQDAIRYCLVLEDKTRDATKYLKRALKAVSDALKAQHAKQDEYLVHALRVDLLAEGSSKGADTSDLLTRVSKFLIDCKLWGEKSRVDERAIQLHQKTVSEEGDLQLPRLLDTLATTYDEQGQYDKAIKVRSELLNQRRKLQGEKNPETIHSMKSLAKSHLRQGQYVKAEEVCNEVIGLQTEVLGTKNRSTLRGISLLASTYRKQGRLDESRDTYANVVELKRGFLGDTHKSTITTMRELAGAECRLGNYDASEKLRLEVWELQRKAHGETHRNSINAKAALAKVYQRQKRYDEAASLRAEVLKSRRDRLGDTNEKTIDAMMCLASTYRELGRHDEAFQLSREALSTRQRLLGDENPLTQDALMGYASTLRWRGELDEASKVAQGVFEWERQRIGVDHPEALNTMASMAKILHAQGRHRNAIALMDECVRKRRVAIGAQHRRTKEAETTVGEWKAALTSGDGKTGVRARL